MLVFLSDTHLTDNKASSTINSGAFEKFAFYLREMAKKAKAKEIELVLLGDIFDVIRSDTWLRSDSIRPWSSDTCVDSQNESLKSYTIKIVKDICGQEDNLNSRQHFFNLKNYFENEHVRCNITYIPGNHDKLINTYSETRIAVADFLHIDNVPPSSRFPTFQIWPEYKVFARHGDIYDPMNYTGDNNNSSLGDAIVIDLLTQFSTKIKSECSHDLEAISLLNEIDNVRPILEIPAWVHYASLQTTNKNGELIKRLWNETVNQFLAVEYVRSFNTAWPFDTVDLLHYALTITRLFSLKKLASVPLAKLRFPVRSFAKKAFEEEAMQTKQAQSVVYGHTHRHCLEPLDNIVNTQPGRMYFNTGTWRKIHERTLFDKSRYEFINWHEMTFIVFYRDDERKGGQGNKYTFEIWHGALG